MDYWYQIKRHITPKRASICPEEHPAGFLAWSQRKPREKKSQPLELGYSVSEGYIRASPYTAVAGQVHLVSASLQLTHFGTQ